MNDPVSQSAPRSAPSGNAVLFAPEGPQGNSPQKTERNWLPWIVAAIVILVIVALIFFLGDKKSAQPTSSVNPYAAQVTISHVQLSQATNFAGDQLTYIDGTITNHGNQTVTGISVRVLFANDDGEQPQTERVPLHLIRTREPYVDTEPVSAAPLKPGASQDFRLIFDDISPLWNQQIPAIQIESLSTQ